MRLADKVAIITGSAGGMGKLAAETFAHEGAGIVVTDIADEEGEEVARSIRDAGGKAIFVHADVAKENDVKHMVAAAIDAFGHVDILYNNAGIMPAGGGDGLKPSSYGKRIAFDGPGRTVIDGPFAETRELVAGFWLWEVKDLDEAVAWVKRCPNPMPGPSEIEIRPFYEMADLQ